MDASTGDCIKSAVEAILFISEKPVTVEQLKDVLETVGAAEIKQALQDLMKEYEDNRRGMTLVEIAEGYQMLSSPHYVSYIRNFFKTRVKEKLSRPALETLAIIAYKQPVSRADIEVIRGVNSDGVVVHLLTKALTKIVGRKDVPGRPYLYGTTKLFLEYFGLKALDDLPKLEEVTALLKTSEEKAEILPVTEEEARAEQQALTEKVQHEQDVQIEKQVEAAITPSSGAAATAADAMAVPAAAEDSSDAAVEEPAELKHVMEEMNKNDETVKSSTPADVPAGE